MRADVSSPQEPPHALTRRTSMFSAMELKIGGGVALAALLFFVGRGLINPVVYEVRNGGGGAYTSVGVMEAFENEASRFMAERAIQTETGGALFWQDDRDALTDSMKAAHPGNPVLVMPGDTIWMRWTPLNWFGAVRRGRVQRMHAGEMREVERRDVVMRAGDVREDGRYWNTWGKALRHGLL